MSSRHELLQRLDPQAPLRNPNRIVRYGSAAPELQRSAVTSARERSAVRACPALGVPMRLLSSAMSF